MHQLWKTPGFWCRFAGLTPFQYCCWPTCAAAQQLQSLSHHGPAALLLLLLLLSLAKMQNACAGANPCISSSTLAEQSSAFPVTGASSIQVRLQRCSSEHLNNLSNIACNGTVLAVWATCEIDLKARDSFLRHTGTKHKPLAATSL
jgi:hypothetical protein